MDLLIFIIIEKEQRTVGLFLKNNATTLLKDIHIAVKTSEMSGIKVRYYY